MGAEYYSYLRVVVDVTEADIIEEVTTTITVCDHTHSSKFCPECGIKPSKRTRTKTRKQFTKPFAHLAKNLDIAQYADEDEKLTEDVYEEPDLHTILYEWEGDVGLHAGLKLKRLDSSFIDDGPLVLAADVSRVGGYGRGMQEIRPGDLEVVLESARKTVANLGIDRKPRLIHMMYCSV